MAHYVIMGCGRVGSALAHTLEDTGHSIAVIDQDARSFRHIRAHFQGQRILGIGFDREVLKEANIHEAYAFAAVSSGDNSNIIAARMAQEVFHVPHVVARVYDPNRAEIYQRLGIPTVAAVRWSTDQVLRRVLPEYSKTGHYREPSGRLVLTEASLHEQWIGHPFVTIEQRTQTRIAYIARFGEGTIPTPTMVYQQGDIVNIMVEIARKDSVERFLALPPQDRHRGEGSML